MSDETDPPDGDAPVVYQPRCVFCGCEHYVMNVAAISHGEAGCGRCGKVPPVYTRIRDYQAAMRTVRDRVHNHV